MKIKIPFLTTKIDEDIGLIIALFWIFWIIGLNAVAYHISIFIVFIKLLYLKKRQLKTHSSIKFLVVFAGIYLLSIIIHKSFFDNSRFVASLYNLSMWILGIMMIIIIINLERLDLNRICRIIYINQIIMLSILGMSYILWRKGINAYTVKSIIERYAHLNIEFGLIKTTLNLLVYRIDWIANTVILRFSAGFTYPNLVGGYGLIALPASYYYLNNKYNNKLAIFFRLFLLSIPIIMSLSRSALALLILGIFLSFMWYMFQNNKKKFYQYIKIIVVFGILVSAISLMTNTNIYKQLNDIRSGSSNTRAKLYLNTIKVFQQNPIIGVGIKAKVQEKSLPIGSHSTYLGALYKTGILGSVFLFLFIFKMIRVSLSILKLNTTFDFKVLALFYLMFIIWISIEDIDATTNLSFYYFLFSGIILKKYNDLKGETFLYENLPSRV